MRFPKLKKIKRVPVIRHVFGGLVGTQSVPEGCFTDMENLSSDAFPLLSVRPQRAVWNGAEYDGNGILTGFSGLKMFGHHGITAAVNTDENICFCASSHVYIDGEAVPGVVLDTDVKRHTVIPFGRNYFIIPEGIYILRTDDSFEIRHAGASVTISENAEVFPCLAGGEPYERTVSDGFPASPEDLDEAAVYTEEDSFGLYRFGAETGEWELLSPLFTAVRFTETDDSFSVSDRVAVTLDGESAGRYTVAEKTEDLLILAAPPVFVPAAGQSLTLTKTMPPLDFAVEHNNRIFGCRAGKNADGETVNEIMVSALGDPLAWNRFEGVSTDSFTASLGCPGEFTGAGVLKDSVVFFKEYSITEISGSSPADFTVRSFPARGVQKGAELSVVNLNEKLFYKSRTCVNVFDGYLPYSVSDDLGLLDFDDVVAGTADGKYYMAGTDGSGKRSILVFDTAHGVWHRESSPNVRFFVNIRNCLYAVVLAVRMGTPNIPVNVYLFTIHNKDRIPDAKDLFSGEDSGTFRYTDEGAVKWFAKTGVMGANEPETRTLRMLAIRFRTEKDASFTVSAELDGDGLPRLLYSCADAYDGTVNIPLRLPKCDHFRLLFEGQGGCLIRSVAYCYEKNAEVSKFE